MLALFMVAFCFVACKKGADDDNPDPDIVDPDGNGEDPNGGGDTTPTASKAEDFVFVDDGVGYFIKAYVGNEKRLLFLQHIKENR